MRLIDADELLMKCMSLHNNAPETVSWKMLTAFVAIVDDTPTVESHDIKMMLNQGMDICFHHVPSMMGKEYDRNFGRNLKRICEENDVTIKEIADGAGVSCQTLYAITKRMTKKPSPETQMKVFNYLKTRIPELLIEDIVTAEIEEAEQ